MYSDCFGSNIKFNVSSKTTSFWYLAQEKKSTHTPTRQHHNFKPWKYLYPPPFSFISRPSKTTFTLVSSSFQCVFGSALRCCVCIFTLFFLFSFFFFFLHFTHFAENEDKRHWSGTVALLQQYCLWDPQPLYSLKNIKNGSHGTIYTFKNYFATVFSVFSFQFQQQ